MLMFGALDARDKPGHDGRVARALSNTHPAFRNT